MSKVTVVRFVILASIFLLPTPSIRADRNTTHYYRMRILGDAEANVEGIRERIQANSFICYSWGVQGNRRVLEVQSIGTKVKKGEDAVTGGTQSSHGVSFFADDNIKQVSIKYAPEVLQEFLRASFDVPLCELTIDNRKAESGRRILASENARKLLVDGTIQNAVLFHAHVDVLEQQWSAPTVVNSGQGWLIAGTLNYKRILENKNLVTCRVSGTCAKDVIDQPNAPILIKDVKYSISGSQTYDSQLGEWVSGKLKMVYSNRAVERNDLEIGSVVGVLTLELTSEDGPPTVFGDVTNAVDE